MAPSRSRVICCALIALCIAAAARALSVRTTIPSVQSSGTFKSVGANASIVTGPLQTTPALFLGNKLYVQVPQAIVALDLTQNSSSDMISSAMARAYPSMPSLAAAIDDPRVPGRLIVLSYSPCRVAYMNATTLDFIPQIFPNYPVTLGAFGSAAIVGAFPGTVADEIFIVIGKSAIARLKFDLQAAAVDSLAMEEGDVISSGYYDETRKEIYIGLNGGRVWKYDISDSSIPLSSAPKVELLLSSSSDVATMQSEPLKDRIYFVSAGFNSTHPAVVTRVNLTDFTVETVLELTDRDYLIADSILDSVRGYMVLVANPESVPRLLQIDLPSFEQEYTLDMTLFQDDLGQINTIIMDADRKRLFLGSLSASLQETQLTVMLASDNCPGECFDHGSCEYRTCACASFNSTINNEIMHWLPPSCEGRTCEYNCNNDVGSIRGVCSFNGTCLCDDIWGGEFCEIRQCPKNCSGRGVCGGLQSNYTCACDDGFGGIACNQVALLRCPLYKTCSDCSLNPACGWCGSGAGSFGGACMYGDARGPTNSSGAIIASCRNWHYQECDVIVSIINCVVTILLALTLIVALLGVPIELGASDEYSRRLSWYRYQRGYKVMTLFLQLQYVGALTFLADTLPTAFTTFTRTWLWPNFAIGLPFNQFTSGLTQLAATTTSKFDAGRALLSVDQYTVYSETSVPLIFPGVLFWWVVILGICYFIFFLAMAVVAVVRGTDRVSAHLGQWIAYIFFEAANWGYFPIVFSGFVQIVLGPKSLVAVAGAFAVLIVGILWPVFGIIITRILNKKLFAEVNKIKYMPINGHAVPRALNWSQVPLIKNFLLAAALGLLSTGSTIAQLVLCMIIFAAWFVLILVKGEDIFADYLQRRLEILLAVVNFVSFGVILAFAATSLSGAAVTGITLTFIIIQLVGVVACLLFFIIVWFQANEIYSCSQFAAFLCCRATDDK